MDTKRIQPLMRWLALFAISRTYELTLLIFLCFSAIVIAPCRCQAQSADDVSNQYRLSIYPSYPIKGDLSGGGEFTFVDNPDRNLDRYYFGIPQLSLKVTKWLGLRGGLRTIYTDNNGKSDTLELRPWLGATFNIPNPWKWHIYNYARFEYRDTLSLEKDTWSDTYRIRSRFGVEMPLTQRERAWKSKTWYGLADVEPSYRFDEHAIDPVRIRGGIGYIVNDRLRLEFLYGAQFSRPNNGGLQYTGNGFRVNVRLAFADGLL
ncbi:MAG: DUF2490 domain-containing protein [Limisphaerales bacterium]